MALHCFLRIFLDYKGALLYKMQAGMGDVVIAPLFQVLESEGCASNSFTGSTSSCTTLTRS